MQYTCSFGALFSVICIRIMFAQSVGARVLCVVCCWSEFCFKFEWFVFMVGFGVCITPSQTAW